MNASIFSFIMMGICGIGIVAGIFVALVRGVFAEWYSAIQNLWRRKTFNSKFPGHQKDAEDIF